MKKSFKKAGAAVLSMAMLLAMGAVTMPVYAAPATPGSVTVSIPGAFKQGQGDSDYQDEDERAANEKYDYLDLEGVTSAQVGMYKVAELLGSGWQWSGIFADQDYTPTDREGFTSFEDLLEQVGGNGTDKDNFVYSSTELQKLASHLERVIRNLKVTAAQKENGSPTAAAQDAQAALDDLFKRSQTLTPDNPTVTIPGDNSTMNKIAWYLLMTETNESGVVIQPVLVSLKNGEQNPIKASLKGTKIRVDKSIVDVSDTTTTVADSKDTAVVAKDDVVTYQIKAQLPTYDSNVKAADITTFVIDDTASAGVNMKEDTLKVYLSADGEFDPDEDYELAAGANNDYTYTMKTNNNGFTVSLTGNQLNGYANTSTLDTIKTDDVRTYATMQGMYIFVVCDATVNEKWTAADVTAAVNAYKTANPAASDEAAAAAVAAQGIVAGDYKFKRIYNDYVDIDGDSAVTQEQFDDIGDDEVISAINRGVYTDDELDEANFENVTAVTADFDDVVTRKTKMVNGEEKDVYLTVDGHETTDASLAATDTANKYDDHKLHAETVTTTGLRNRVKLLLARDKANDANGNKNDVDMKYGNIYSTGGGEAHDRDSTKLFSVDVNFDKYTQTLTLSEASQITDGAGVLTWLGLPSDATADQIHAKLAEKAATVASVPEEANYDAGMVTALTTLDSTLTNDEAKKVASLIKTENDNRTANGGYASETTDIPVQNAVFKLSKVNADDTTTLVSYAASDAAGDLRLVETATKAQYDAYAADPDNVPSADVGKIFLKVTEGTGDDAVTSYYYYTATSENAWKMLTEGTYQLEEVYAPAGYKKSTGAATFTIACAKDGVSEDYTGEFSGESNSDLFRDLEERQDPNKQTVEFDFDGAKGELKNNIYNELADTLPATGGIGTVLFTAGGIAVVLMAGGLFVMYMKKRNSEEEE